LLSALRAQELVACHGFHPPPYLALKRSIYVHSKPRELLPLSDLFVCSCDPATGGCDERCQNRALQQECQISTCPCGALCQNRLFSAQTEPSCLQVFLTEDKGWGLKTLRTIQQGELVIEYVGEIIDAESWENRKKERNRYDHMYFMALNQNEIVDASRKGNIARFINHSCQPTLTVEKWYSNRIPRLCLFAKVQIAEGEELTYNYSVKWFGNPDYAQRCYCGASCCTGFLGRAPT